MSNNMKSTADSADKLGKIIRSAGFEFPDKGLTERIMNRIEVATIKRPLVFKPVIGFRGWLLIAVSGILLLVLSYFLLGNSGNDTGTGITDSTVLFQRLHQIEPGFIQSIQVPKILLLSLIGLLFWIALDFLMATRKWKKHYFGQAK